MANWSNWMDWGGKVPGVQSLNNLYGPPSPGPGYQWLRPTNPAWYPTPSGPQFPMFNAAGAPNYPMFGPNAGVPNVSVGAGPMPALTWAEQAAAAGYAPQTSTVPRVPMFDAAGNPASIPRPMFDAVGNPTPISQTYTPGSGVPTSPQVPGGATQFKTPLVPNQPSLMPNAVPMDLVNPTRAAQYTPGPGVPATPQVPGGVTAYNTPMFGPGSGRPTTPPPGTAPTPVNVPPPTNGSFLPGASTGKPTSTKYTIPGTRYAAPTPVQTAGLPGSGPLSPPPVPPPSAQPAANPGASPGGANLYTRRAAANAAAGSGGGGGAASPSGTGAAGAPTPPTPGAPTPAPANPYAAFRGANPFNIRGVLSPTGAVGSKLPGFATNYIPPIGNTAVASRLPAWATANHTGWKGFGLGVAGGAAVGMTPLVVNRLAGADPNSYGARTGRDAGTLAAFGLGFGAPVAGAIGVGSALGNAVGGSGGLGVANWLRENMPEWMPGDVEKQGPTDDTVGDILGRVPYIGGFFGGDTNVQPTTTEQQPLPPTLDSIAQVASMANIDPESTQLLQSQFQSGVGVAMAQYTANPEAFTRAWKEGNPEFQGEVTPEVIEQSVFQQVIDMLPDVVAQQGARQAMLQNAAAYQEALAPYLAPLQAQAQQAASSLANAGPGFSSYATYAQQLPSIIENQIRLAPQVAAMTEYQNLIDQQSQQTLAQMLGNGGGAGQSFDALTAGQDQQLLAG